jgi:hypothetical protein
MAAVFLWGCEEAQTEMIRCFKDYPGSVEANMTLLLLHLTPEMVILEGDDGEGGREDGGWWMVDDGSTDM